MKKVFIFSFFLVSYIMAQPNHFRKGVNLTSWFQSENIGQVQFTKYTKQDFINIKSLGCDVIRLPINIRGMTSGYPDYIFEGVFLNFLDEVIDWAEEVQINLILDNHTFDVNVSTSGLADRELIPQWTQLAERYKGKPNYLYYEILNEPHGINDLSWNTIQQNVVEAIREIDTVHTIIVGGAGWNSYNNLEAIPVYEDKNLIYTFHFFDPFLFTHQGASWVSDNMVLISGIPFPYSADSMPVFPDAAKGDWEESNYNNYQYDGTIEKVQELIDKAVIFRDSRNVEVFCGEFGVYIRNSPPDDRVYWYDVVRSYLEEKNISWTIWDYHGGFGIFNENSDGLFNSDLNVPLVEALGLVAPQQSEFVPQPDSTGFSLYTDYVAAGMRDASSWGMSGLNFYSEENPIEGNYCIAWTGANRYNQIGFDFKPNKDLSELFSENYMLSLYIKGEAPGDTIDIRFVDTDTEDSNDHPWRMSYKIDETVTAWDGNWHHLNISLSSFHDSGAWEENTWFDPMVGAFDWTAIDRFEIVTEYHDIQNRTLWFDNIEIVDPASVGIKEEKLPEDFILYQNYPNPFNPVTSIKYEIAEECKVDLRVYDILGREAAVLVNNYQKSGKYQVQFNANSLSSGVYFYTITAGKYVNTKKLLRLK